MKRIVMIASIAVAAMTWTMAQEKGLEDRISLEGTIDLYSAHVWRGFVANDRPVWQPSGTIAFDADELGKVGASVWANLDLSNRNKRWKRAGLGEIDYTLFYGIDLEGLELEAGHTWYTYRKVLPRNDHSTREVYGSIAYDNEIIKPFFSVNHDYAALHGAWYINAGLNKEVDINEQLTLGAQSALGWGDDDFMEYYFNSNGSGLADSDTSIYASYALTDQVSVGARLGCSVLLDTDARRKRAYRAAGSWEKHIFYGGVSLNVAL